VLVVDRTRRRDTATIDVPGGAGRWVLRCDQDPDVTTELDDRYELADLDRAAAYLTEAIAAAHHVAPDRIDLSIHPTRSVSTATTAPATSEPADGAAADGAGLWLTPVRVVHRRLTHHASARPVVLAAAAIATATGVAATTILAVTTTGPREAQLPGWMSASYQPLSWVSAAALLLLLLLVFSVHRRVTGRSVLAAPVFSIAAPNLWANAVVGHHATDACFSDASPEDDTRVSLTTDVSSFTGTITVSGTTRPGDGGDHHAGFPAPTPRVPPAPLIPPAPPGRHLTPLRSIWERDHQLSPKLAPSGVSRPWSTGHRRVPGFRC